MGFWSAIYQIRHHSTERNGTPSLQHVVHDLRKMGHRRVLKITASTLPVGVSAQVPMAPDVALRVGGRHGGGGGKGGVGGGGAGRPARRWQGWPDLLRHPLLPGAQAAAGGLNLRTKSHATRPGPTARRWTAASSPRRRAC